MYTHNTQHAHELGASDEAGATSFSLGVSGAAYANYGARSSKNRMQVHLSNINWTTSQQLRFSSPVKAMKT